MLVKHESSRTSQEKESGIMKTLKAMHVAREKSLRMQKMVDCKRGIWTSANPFYTERHGSSLERERQNMTVWAVENSGVGLDSWKKGKSISQLNIYMQKS